MPVVVWPTECSGVPPPLAQPALLFSFSWKWSAHICRHDSLLSVTICIRFSTPPPPQDPSPLRGTLGSSLRPPAEGEGIWPDSLPTQCTEGTMTSLPRPSETPGMCSCVFQSLWCLQPMAWASLWSLTRLPTLEPRLGIPHSEGTSLTAWLPSSRPPALHSRHSSDSMSNSLETAPPGVPRAPQSQCPLPNSFPFALNLFLHLPASLKSTQLHPLRAPLSQACLAT